MIWYMDSREAGDVEQLDSGVIRYLIRKGEAAAHRYNRLWDYYCGRHDILRTRWEPEEVRVAVNYAKYVVDTTLGYYLGQPVKYDPNPDCGDIRPFVDCCSVRQMAGIDQELGKTMGIMGDCLELCYASDERDPRPRSAAIDPRNGILVCDATVEHNKLFAIIWDRLETPQGRRYYHAQVYTAHTCKEYIGDDLQTALFHQVGETREHYFGQVPVIAYTNNQERQGDFEQIMTLIDAYDRLMSDRLTDKRKFVDALLVFFGMTLEEEEGHRLERERFIDGAPLDARAEYIQKTFDEAGIQVLADALTREMHKMTMTVDMSDRQFAGNASGQALKLKLLTLNLLVQNKTRRMERGLKERFRLYNHWLAVKGEMAEVPETQIDVVFTLNLPVNEAEIVDMVTRLQGIVDRQTLLSQLWFIHDPKEAAENLQLEREDREKSHRAAGEATPRTPPT